MLGWALLELSNSKYCDPDDDICFILPYIGHGYGMETRYHTLSCCSVNAYSGNNSKRIMVFRIKQRILGRMLSQETNYSADRKISIDYICIGFVDVEYNGK